MMSSMFRYLYTLFYFLTLYIIIIDTRSIDEKDTNKFIVDNLINEQNHEFLITLANYRHRFEHSINFKKIRWTLKHRYDKAYCQFCDLVVPVVNDPKNTDNAWLETSICCYIQTNINKIVSSNLNIDLNELFPNELITNEKITYTWHQVTRTSKILDSEHDVIKLIAKRYNAYW
ncbi:unnamed protein product [Rotaria sp. Silwood1]|nr:unnamed protein product [Rotaria sp. Silwood1]